MKKIYLLILSILLWLPVISQNFWEEIDVPDTAKTYCVDINQNGTIFIGTLKTYPGGGRAVSFY